MTHARWHNSWEAALVGALHNLTDADLRHATGRARDYLSKLSVPGNGRELWFSHAAALDRALVAKGLPPQFLPLLQDNVAPAPAATVAVDTALRRATVELGELTKAVDDAMADGRMALAERRRIAKEGHDVIDQVKKLLLSIEPPGEAVGLRSV